ncbi:MAG TPA: hypothetical protein VGN98_03235 [Tianweitania sediminis]|jgi:hypothetical protein|nr:hypothetical protein [Tianweitania sediminis]
MTNPYNAIIGFPNRIDSATLSGGAWADSLPLAHLKDRMLSRVARTANTDPAGTWFIIDLGRQRAVRLLAFINHNNSFSGRFRVRGSNSLNFDEVAGPLPTQQQGKPLDLAWEHPDWWNGIVLEYDVTFDAWPAATSDWNIDELEWEADNYWVGSFTQEDTEGQTPASIHILPEGTEARYWRIDLIDPQNQAGFLEIGRIFIGDVFLQPRINMSWGANLAYETATAIETALGGAEFFDPRESLRVMRFQLAYLSEEEGFAKALELTRRAGIHLEVLFIGDPTDRTYGSQRNFLGRLRTLNPLEQAMFQLTSMAFEIKELR